jgi:hypothetical protein
MENFKILGPPIPGFIEIVNQFKKEGMVVAEIGTYDGGTSLAIAPIVKEVNGKYIAIDWFIGNETIQGLGHGYDEGQHDTVLDNFRHNINEVGCNGITTIYDMPSLEAATLIEDKSLDICFIDADHRYKAVKEDILAYASKVKDDGILCGHDLEDGIEIHFNTWSEEELENDTAREGHAGVCQAVGEIIGFEKITRYPNFVWAVKINKNREFEKV